METDIKFTDTNSFSIRCGKCADIHNAQLDGKTDKPCKCDCHEKPEPVRYVPYCPPDPCCPHIYPPYTPTFISPTTADPQPFTGTTFYCTTSGTQDTTQGPTRTRIDYQ